MKMYEEHHLPFVWCWECFKAFSHPHDPSDCHGSPMRKARWVGTTNCTDKDPNTKTHSKSHHKHRPRESQSSRYMFPKSVLSRVKFPPFPLFWFHAEDFKVGCSQQVMKLPAKPSYKRENFGGALDLVSFFAPMFQDLPYLHKSCNLRKKEDPVP